MALTKQQKIERIEQLICQGLPNKLIALKVFLAEGTVKNHISTIYSQHKVRNRKEYLVKKLTKNRSNCA